MSDLAERVRPPMPGDCHPRLECLREDLVRWLDEARSPEIYSLLARDPGNSTYRSYVQVTIIRRKVQAWAPFVGKPFGYWWHVGVDNEGNGVSGTRVRSWDIEYGPLWNAWLTAGDEDEDDDRG